MGSESKDQHVLGIDIGGTSIKAAVVDIEEGTLLGRTTRVNTPQPAVPKSMLQILKDIVRQYHWKGKVGCGFPGIVKNHTIDTAANLSKDWIGVNLKDELERFTGGKSVHVLNDADAAALSEMTFGSGKEYNNHGGGVVLVATLGTGIGTAIFLDGHLLPNTEFGHMEMDGKDAEKWAATIVREKEQISWEMWGGRVNKFFQIMEMLLSPDVIIIGGGVSQSPEKFIQFLNLKAKLLTAKMGNDAGIIGAALGCRVEI